MNEVERQEQDWRASQIVERSSGVHPPYEAFYIESIVYSAERALAAFDRYDAARQRDNAFPEIVGSVHEALGHAAALSRFFWPSKGGPWSRSALVELRKARAEKLKRAFEIAENSPLRNRKLRDAIEHFDERLDQFLLNDSAGMVMPRPIVGECKLVSECAAHLFRCVNPESSYFVLLGESYGFGDLRIEVERIHQMAVAASECGGRLRKAD